MTNTKHAATRGKKDGKAFCDDRKNLCEEQVDENCLADHKKGLESAQKKCEDADSDRQNKCESEELGKLKEESMTKCRKDKTPKCEDDCKGKCNVEGLTGCLANLKSNHDATEDFCKDFWRLLHESSEVDPVTGTPIVLLES